MHDGRFSVGRIGCRISVYLPRVPGGLPSVRLHPFSDCGVGFVHAVVRPPVDRDGSLARRRFGRIHFAGSFKCACDLDAEVAQYRRAGLLRVMVEEDVVAVGPQTWLAADEGPDLAQGRSPRRANRARGDLAPHRGQLTRVNSLQVDGDWHLSITPGVHPMTNAEL